MRQEEFVQKWVESFAADRCRLFKDKEKMYNSLPAVLKLLYRKPSWNNPDSYNGFHLLPILNIPRKEYKILSIDYSLNNEPKHDSRALFRSPLDIMICINNKRILSVKNNFNNEIFSIGDTIPYYGKIVSFYLFYYKTVNIRVVFDNNTDECLRYLGTQP